MTEPSARGPGVIPVLRIFDEAVARRFYLDFLGFELEWEHRYEPGCGGPLLLVTDPFANQLRFCRTA